MEIRASGSKIQEEKFVLQSAVATLQQRFMLVSKNNKKVQTFYLSHVVPLLSQLESFTSLEDIDVAFKRLCGTSVNSSQHPKQVGLFESEAKEIDSDIREGYIHILELYKLYFMYHFIQTHLLLPQTKESPLMTPVAVEEKVEPVKLTTIQSVAIEKSLFAYQSITLEDWSQTVFSPLPTTLPREVKSLKQKTDTFNERIKKLMSEEEKKSILDPFVELLVGEERFAYFQKNLDSLTAEHKQLELERDHFIKERDQAILSLEIAEDLHCTALTSTPPVMHFPQKDRQLIAKTAECIAVVAQHSSEQDIFKNNQVILETTLNRIAHLQEWLTSLRLLCQYKSFLGDLSMRHRIAALLNEAIESLKNVCAQYRGKTLEKTKTDLAILMDKSHGAYRQAIKDIIKQCRQQIRKKLSDVIQPFQQAALDARKQKYLSYLRELKLQFAVTSIDTDSLKLLCEKQLQRAVQLDQAWHLMMEQIIRPYQDRFAKIKAEVTASISQETQKRILGQLEELYNEIDLKRYLLLIKVPDGSECDPVRRDVILRLINQLAPLMLCIGQARQDLFAMYVKQQFSLYRSRFEAIETELKSVAEKVKAMQMLEKELKEFTSQHKPSDKIDAQILRDIQRYLSYENLRRAQVEEKIESYRARFLRFGVTAKSTLKIQRLKEEFYGWCNEEKKLIWNECSSPVPQVNKYNYIIKPMNDFAFHIEGNYPELPSSKARSMPEFSICCALIWTICVPLIGFCIYMWWYNRQCRQATASLKRRKSLDLHIEIPMPSTDSDSFVKSAMSIRPLNPRRRRNRKRVARGDEVFSEETITYHIYHQDQTFSSESPQPRKREVHSAQLPANGRQVKSIVH